MLYPAHGYRIRFEVHTPSTCPNYVRGLIYRAGKATLQALPRSVLSHHLNTKTEYQLIISVISSRKMQNLNAQFRGKDRPTDVLSFSNLPEKTPIPESSAGDIFLCLPVVRDNAKRFGVSFRQELYRMTVHGILHVFGYDHEQSKAEERRMFILQEKVVSKIESPR